MRFYAKIFSYLLKFEHYKSFNKYIKFVYTIFVFNSEKKRKDMVTFLAVRVEPEKGNGSIPGEGIFCGVPEAGCFFAGCYPCSKPGRAGMNENLFPATVNPRADRFPQPDGRHRWSDPRQIAGHRPCGFFSFILPGFFCFPVPWASSHLQFPGYNPTAGHGRPRSG